jgi:hypothetical protein
MSEPYLIKARPGFHWSLVVWHPGDRPLPLLCSYCHGKIAFEDVPLMMWKKDGSLAQFCEACIKEWFGFA